MTSSGEYWQCATKKLTEVNRKLVLVECLSPRISREARDLTRTMASVAAMEEILAHLSLTPDNGVDVGVGTIGVVGNLHPKAVATSVRQAAASFMN